jgi:hypothetical protein
VKLNPGLPWESSIQEEEESFDKKIGLEFKEATSKMLHLGHSFVYY